MPSLDDSWVILSDKVVRFFMIELEIDGVDNEDAETEKELRDGCCSELTTATDNGIICAIINDNVSLGKYNLRHQMRPKVYFQNPRQAISRFLLDSLWRGTAGQY